MRIPELLAPVGSMEHLKVAINAGASSVYLSGKDYGARKFAQNFTLDEINDAVNIAHMHNVKVYVTVNTLIKEDELEDVINYLSKLYAIGVDAVLVQDLGLVELINEHLPNLKIHASTQMTIENQLKLDYIESKGIKRVVLPREMKKEEIQSLKTNMELEIFAYFHYFLHFHLVKLLLDENFLIFENLFLIFENLFLIDENLFLSSEYFFEKKYFHDLLNFEELYL